MQCAPSIAEAWSQIFAVRESNRLKRDTPVHYLTSILSTRKFEDQSRQIPDLVMLLEQKLSVAKIQTNEMACVVSSLFSSRLAAIRPLLVLVQKSERSIFGKGAKGHSGMM